METVLRLIRDTETATILGCFRATVWALAKAGKIPTPVKIGAMSRWRLSDIQTVIERAAEQTVLEPKPRPRERKRTFR